MYILSLLIALAITELGLFSVFLDALMGNRNSAIGSVAILSVFVFPVLIVPGVMRSTIRQVIIACFIAATLCMAYFLAIYRHLLPDQDMMVFLLSYSIVVIITAALTRKDGQAA